MNQTRYAGSALLAILLSTVGAQPAFGQKVVAVDAGLTTKGTSAPLGNYINPGGNYTLTGYIIDHIDCEIGTLVMGTFTPVKGFSPRKASLGTDGKGNAAWTAAAYINLPGATTYVIRPTIYYVDPTDPKKTVQNLVGGTSTCVFP
jgi:hypothetical protein